MLFKTIYKWFKLVEFFAQRDFPNPEVVLPFGYRLMKVREFYEACEERRLRLVEKHGVKRDNEVVVGEDGHAEFENRAAFEREWKEMLESEVENYPDFQKRLDANDLPKETTPLETEALLRLNLLNKPEVWD
jgi:hypothetical protein